MRIQIEDDEEQEVTEDDADVSTKKQVKGISTTLRNVKNVHTARQNSTQSR